MASHLALSHPVIPGLTRDPAAFSASGTSGTPGQARGDGEGGRMASYFTVLKQDAENEIWSGFLPWLKCAADIYRRHVEQEDSFPFHSNEQCAVSLLLAGATAAGHLSLMECDIDKGDGRGRADLWLSMDGRQLWFEFKRSAFNPLARRWGLDHAFSQVSCDLEKIYFDEEEVGVICVIAATDKMTPEYRNAYTKFLSRVDFAVRLGPDDEDGVILYFKIQG